MTMAAMIPGERPTVELEDEEDAWDVGAEDVDVVPETIAC